MNTQHIDNTTKNDLPLPVSLMKRCGINRSGISRMTGCSDQTVGRVLDPALCGSVSYSSTRVVRRQIEAMLKAAGIDTRTLWDEYESSLDKAA